MINQTLLDRNSLLEKESRQMQAKRQNYATLKEDLTCFHALFVDFMNNHQGKKDIQDIEDILEVVRMPMEIDRSKMSGMQRHIYEVIDDLVTCNDRLKTRLLDVM